MFNFLDLDQDELAMMHRAYVIVDALARRDRSAKFNMTLGEAELSPAFLKILDHIAEAGIKPGEFAAVHALAQCGMRIREMPPSEASESLENFLFDTTQKLLGPEIKAHLREWMDNAYTQSADLAERGTWAQLGALSRASHYLAGCSALDAAFFAEHAEAMSDLSRSFHAVADATHALAPVDTYFSQQIAAFDRLLPSSQPA
jgi:hypothetical protein